MSQIRDLLMVRHNVGASDAEFIEREAREAIEERMRAGDLIGAGEVCERFLGVGIERIGELY